MDENEIRDHLQGVEAAELEEHVGSCAFCRRNLIVISAKTVQAFQFRPMLDPSSPERQREFMEQLAQTKADETTEEVE